MSFFSNQRSILKLKLVYSFSISHNNDVSSGIWKCWRCVFYADAIRVFSLMTHFPSKTSTSNSVWLTYFFQNSLKWIFHPYRFPEMSDWPWPLDDRKKIISDSTVTGSWYLRMMTSHRCFNLFSPRTNKDFERSISAHKI